MCRAQRICDLCSANFMTSKLGTLQLTSGGSPRRVRGAGHCSAHVRADGQLSVVPGDVGDH